MWNAFRHFLWHLRDRQRTLLCAPLGIGVGIIGWKIFGWIEEVAILAGWILGVGSYLVLLGAVIFMADGPMTQRRVSKDNPSHKYLLIVVIIVALLVNATLGVILTSVGNRPASNAHSLLMLSVLSVVLSWFLLHTAFGQQYARLYYDDFDEQGRPFPGGMRGGLTFPGTDQPNYLDFLYVAFTVGLTYAMSDVNVTSYQLRRLVLIHSVISFFFYSMVLGVVLNAVVTS
jgi:uncharacterized membrane protein